MHGIDNNIAFRTGVDNTGTYACSLGRTRRPDTSGRFVVFDLPGSGLLPRLTRP